MQLRSLSPNGRRQTDVADGSVHGLFVRIGQNRKTFMLTLQMGGKRRRIAIGYYPDLGLSAARSKARDLLAEARLKPQAPEPDTLSFKEALEQFETTHVPTMRHRTQYECRRVLHKYFDSLEKIPLTELTTPKVTTILDRITSEEKRNAYIWLRLFLNWSYQRGYMDHNPISRLKGMGASNSRDRVLDDREIKAVWKTSTEAKFGAYGAYLRLLLLSGQRRGQWLQFRPEFIDLEGRMIVWPAPLMKTDRPHAIPVTDLMLRILAEHHRFGNWSEGRRTEQIHLESGTSGWHRHDLRRTCATKMSELGIAPHVVEKLLAHSIPGVAGRYNRHQYFSEMRVALETWGDFLAPC